jgi:hypothetical protein
VVIIIVGRRRVSDLDVGILLHEVVGVLVETLGLTAVGPRGPVDLPGGGATTPSASVDAKQPDARHPGATQLQEIPPRKPVSTLHPVFALSPWVVLDLFNPTSSLKSGQRGLDQAPPVQIRRQQGGTGFRPQTAFTQDLGSIVSRMRCWYGWIRMVADLELSRPLRTGVDTHPGVQPTAVGSRVISSLVWDQRDIM